MSARKIISQREARRMRKRVAELEELEARRRRVWATDYPGGTHFWTLSLVDGAREAIGTAQKLGHAIVVKLDGDTRLLLYALKHPEVTP